MKRWTRQQTAAQCGYCREVIPAFAPMLLLRFGTVTKRRCEACAGDAPPDLPLAPGPPMAATPTDMTPVRGLAKMVKWNGAVR